MDANRGDEPTEPEATGDDSSAAHDRTDDNAARADGTADGDGSGIDADLWSMSRRWDSFAIALGDHLKLMERPDDRLILDLGSDRSPQVEFAVTDPDRQLRVTVFSSADLPANRVRALTSTGWTADGHGESWSMQVLGDSDLERVTEVLVQTLNEQLTIPLPALLTCRGAGPSVRALPLAGLTMTPSGQAEEVSTNGPAMLDIAGPISSLAALVPTDRDELFAMVHRLLSEMIRESPEIDDDQDFVLHHLGQRVWVHVDPDSMAVSVVTRVAHRIPFVRHAAAELALLNRDHRWIRWVLRQDTVWQEVSLLGSPFVPKHLGSLIDLFLQTMTETRDDLAYRIKAQVG